MDIFKTITLLQLPKESITDNDEAAIIKTLARLPKTYLVDITELYDDNIELIKEFNKKTLESMRFNYHRMFLQSILHISWVTGVCAIPIIAFFSFVFGLLATFATLKQLQFFGADFTTVYVVSSIFFDFFGIVIMIIALGMRAFYWNILYSDWIKKRNIVCATLGLNKIFYCVLPKALSFIFVAIMLSVVSCITGMIGGYAVVYYKLNMNIALFYSLIIDVVQTNPHMTIWMIVKSCVCGLVICGMTISKNCCGEYDSDDIDFFELMQRKSGAIIYSIIAAIVAMIISYVI
jgi:ABC-type transporter Mla maintaining outer membrane lipid asymmetry permease subunit MlaE